MRDRGSLTGRAYWLSGSSGTGKSTIARLIALEVADEFMIEEVDASALTVASLREESWVWIPSSGKQGQAQVEPDPGEPRRLSGHLQRGL